MTNGTMGIVYVEKNILTVCFVKEKELPIRVNTTKLLSLIESKSQERYETESFSVVPSYVDPDDGAVLVLIGVKYPNDDCDMACVYACDLREALKTITCSETV